MGLNNPEAADDLYQAIHWEAVRTWWMITKVTQGKN